MSFTPTVHGGSRRVHAIRPYSWRLLCGAPALVLFPEFGSAFVPDGRSCMNCERVARRWSKRGNGK